MKSIDTSREIEKIQVNILRKMEPEQRLKLVFQLFETEKKLLIEGIRSRHPEYTEKEIKLALKRIFLGDELFEIVYPKAKGIKP
jgi:hypothetical protein